MPEVSLRVTFKTGQLQRYYESSAKAASKLGQEAARKFIERINILQAIPDFDTLTRMPGLDCRKAALGEWSIKVTESLRLVIVPIDGQLQVSGIQEVAQC